MHACFVSLKFNFWGRVSSHLGGLQGIHFENRYQVLSLWGILCTPQPYIAWQPQRWHLWPFLTLFIDSPVDWCVFPHTIAGAVWWRWGGRQPPADMSLQPPPGSPGLSGRRLSNSSHKETLFSCRIQTWYCLAPMPCGVDNYTLPSPSACIASTAMVWFGGDGLGGVGWHDYRRRRMYNAPFVDMSRCQIWTNHVGSNPIYSWYGEQATWNMIQALECPHSAMSYTAVQIDRN